jgi:hypothetical protein
LSPNEKNRGCSRSLQASRLRSQEELTMKQLYTKIPALVLTLIVGLMATSTAFGTATIVISNGDAPNVGFNDPTPATPVSGNLGTTVGEQRLNAFQFAANVWGATLTSGPTITIRASWAKLSCSANSGVLGQAGNSGSIYRDFAGSVPGTWYGSALRNALTNSDPSINPEINAQFNSELGTTACLTSRPWYYGLNTTVNNGGINLVTVLLHEFAHGLGFQTFTSASSGVQVGDDAAGRFPSIYDRFLLDNSTGKTWAQMTDAERKASAINRSNVVWNGPQVLTDAATIVTPGIEQPGLTGGIDASKRPFVFTPDPFQQGSSVSHWDTTATPNQLMEPNISSNLSHSVTPPQDLTFSLLRDIGWCSGCPQPPPPPSPTPTPIPSPPANDNFANAQTLPGCSGTVNGTNAGATKEAGEPNSPITGSAGSNKSVWYSWQAPGAGTVTVTTAGSGFDTTLAVYAGTSLGSLGTALDRNDDVGDPPGSTFHDTSSKVTFSATAGTVYRIVVNGFDNDGDGGDTGDVVLNWSGCTESATLTSNQVEPKTWTVGGRTYAYLKLLFPNAGYRVASWGQATRVGNDFTADAAVEKFTVASVQAVTSTAQIYDLGPLANGTYNFNFKTSGTLAKTLQFTINSTVPPPNPIDDARQFVKQQYRDFLNREADQAGENFWTDNITKCNDPARRPPGQTVEQCTLRQRETTSGAFFLSPEFQYTGYFVYRMYQGGLGRQPKLSEFIPDAQFVGNGIVVNGQLSGAKINENKAAFAALFVNCTDATKYRCAEFKAIYDGLNNTQYVDKLFQTTQVNASTSERTTLVDGLNNGTETRATVLQKVVDGINVIAEGNQQFTNTYGQAFYNSEFNRAFVELEYFGYMKRDPDDAGYAFWLGKLNQFGGNFVNAEMVLAFISSPEYRAQFGQP